MTCVSYLVENILKIIINKKYILRNIKILVTTTCNVGQTGVKLCHQMQIPTIETEELDWLLRSSVLLD